jgi:hypothetical protein
MPCDALGPEASDTPPRLDRRTGPIPAVHATLTLSLELPATRPQRGTKEKGDRMGRPKSNGRAS